MTPRERLTTELVAALLDYCPPTPGPRFPLIAGEAEEVADALLLHSAFAKTLLVGAAIVEGYEEWCLEYAIAIGPGGERQVALCKLCGIEGSHLPACPFTAIAAALGDET